MISGMYMGELVRLALVKFTKAGLLFGGQGSDLLFKRFQFFTKYVSEIETDKPGTFMNCYDVLEEIGILNATDEDCANVRFICECVSSRAAYLSSAGIAGLINKMNDPSVTVGWIKTTQRINLTSISFVSGWCWWLRLSFPPQIPRSDVQQDPWVSSRPHPVRFDAVGRWFGTWCRPCRRCCFTSIARSRAGETISKKTSQAGESKLSIIYFNNLENVARNSTVSLFQKVFHSLSQNISCPWKQYSTPSPSPASFHDGEFLEELD